ncbi:hypothetical protein ACQKGC_22615 [Allorhizobium pseudoryzae]|uniref:hypothetical protein n=1 Tax=Allorhizobium pseudoryzae TaxID=379684 RepID=UPI003CFEB66D
MLLIEGTFSEREFGRQPEFFAAVRPGSQMENRQRLFATKNRDFCGFHDWWRQRFFHVKQGGSRKPLKIDTPSLVGFAVAGYRLSP